MIIGFCLIHFRSKSIAKYQTKTRQLSKQKYVWKSQMESMSVSQLLHFFTLHLGRASATPSIDALASLLHLGLAGWTELIERRSACFARLRDGLQSVAQKHGLRLLHTEDNPISLAISLNELCDLTSSADNVEPSANRLRCLTQLGSQLFTQGCSGVR